MPCQRMTPAWSHQMFSNTWKIRRVNSLYTWLFSSHHGRNRIKLRMNGDMECVQSVLFSSDVSFFFLVIAATCYILLYYIYNYPTTTSSTSKLRNLNLYNRNTSDYLLLLFPRVECQHQLTYWGYFIQPKQVLQVHIWGYQHG